MGVNADGKISLSVGIDEGQIKQSASQIKSILKKEISTINLDQFFDDKKIQQEVQQSIDSINKVLSKSKFKKIDTSTFVPRIDAIMSNKAASEEERSKIISGYSHQFATLDKYGSKDIIPLLSNSKVLEKYIKDLTNIVDFVQSIKGLTAKEQNRMIKDLSKGDADDIATAFTLKDLQNIHGSNIKYKIKPKDIIPLLQKSIENMDVTNEEQLKDFLGLFNRGKYLAQVDSSKSGVFRKFFEQFESQYKQEIAAFRTQYPDLFSKMEREVIGMSKDFDNLYNTKYKNKPLDSANLVKGLKTDKTINQKRDIQTGKAPTTSQELADTVLSVQSDVDKLDEKIEKAEQLANEAKEAADEVKKEINNTNKNANKNKTNATNIEKKDLKDSKQKNEQQSSPALEQTKEEIDNAIETEENILKRLQEESDLLQTEKEITESTKTKLEKRNETINKVIKNNFKDESKKNNYENLKRQHDNYVNKKKTDEETWQKLDSLDKYSPEWYVQLSKAQQTKEEEEKAWIKYYKAFDIAKNGKNKVAESRLNKFDPKNEGLTEFDNKSYEIYIESLKEAMIRNQKGIDECKEDLEEYQQKKEELDKKINELNKNNSIANDNTSSNKTSPSFNNIKENKSSKPNIPVDLQQELEGAFGFDFSNDIDSTAQAEENLRKKTDDTNKSLEDQNNIIDNIVKKADSLMYYMGQINGDKTVLSNIFGTELQNQNSIATGLLTSKSPKEYDMPVLSNEDLDNYYAIDTSELKMYEAHAEETAKEFYDFIHRLEQFCIMMGSGFEGFDDNLENIDEEALYSTAQKIFPNLEAFFNDFDEFDEYINEMITLVSKSGIGADGIINPIKMRLFQKEFGTDDIKTRFLKQLGYQGVDLSGTSFGKQLGNIVFNPLDNSKILSSGKDINQIVKEVADKIGQSQKNESKTSESSKGKNDSTSIKKAIAEQEELEEKTKKATDALEDQQQTLAQSNVKPSSQNPPEESTKEDDTEKNKSKSKPSVRIKKPIKSTNKDEVKPDLNGVVQGEADSAHEASNEAKGFNLIAGSAEEAAEAKRKFVEANKDVLQSIVASMPKIEQEAKALEKVKEVSNTTKTTKENKSKEDNSKTKDRKGYFDFEAMPNDLIEQRYSEISPLPILAKGVSLASNKLDDEVQSSVELLEELHTAWDRGQQEIKDIIYDSTIENMQQEYVESQRPQYDFEPDYENIAQQAQEARQYYEDQISDDFEVKVETKLNLVEDETGQLSLFDNILPEDNWGQELKQNVDAISQTAIKGQISFQDLENAIKNSEQAYNKLISTKNKDGKSFIQNTDLPDDFLKTYESISTKNGEGYKATSNLRELKNLGDELKDVKTKLKVSFDEVGNLKSTADPLQVQDLLNRYDELIDKIQRLKLIISSPSSQEFFLLEEFKQTSQAAENLETKLNNILANKNFISGKDVDVSSLDEYFQIGSSDNLDKVRSTVEEIKILKEQLQASRDSDGNIIGNSAQVQNLIDKYNGLTNQLKALIDQIRLPDSAETVGLKIAKDAEKAKKELDDLKQKIDNNLGKSGLFEAQIQKTINTYGTFGSNGEGKRGALIESGDLKDERFIKQQEQVQELVSKLREYKTAIQELQTLRVSDDATTKQLTKANDKVKELKDNISTLSQTIKTSGIANASEEQIEKLKFGIESFLQKTPNLTTDIREQLEEYIEILNSGASVSKTSYNSMTADLNKFKSAQVSSTTIWEQMVGKMREGIAFLVTKFSFYQIFNQFRQGFEVIHQFDDALTEMMKVSDETRTSLERYQKTTFETADAIGTNALQIQNSTADFMRLGETLDQAAKSAKSANILMNVSEFQSIDEATKSLIAMGAAYDDLSKMNIIDKLNEVGNNYAISTSEAATALQSSASALKTAGNDMDEALALITAGNAVVQDANKVGTGMRTIALRLTGTKSAKEELEEMGEETENVITTQSKLRDTIKEATAVASNGFKGFDILDDNGNYKSTYEIMLGIADVYNEILETDKQFGRNNANLLLESVAGKNRANIAASIFQNPQLLKDAYQSSQEANGSAMRENDKYVQSISGHLAQLTNAWQEMWANAANRDVINFFIDAAKAAVNFANAVGILPTTFALMLPYLNIITKARSKDNKGIVTQFLDWANGLNEAKKAAKEMAETQEVLNATKEAGIAISTAEITATEAETAANVEGTAASVGKTAANEGETVSTLELTTAEVTETGAEEASTKADIEGAAASAAKSAANMGEAASEAANGVAGFGELIGGKLISGVGRFTGAIAGLASTIGAIPLLLIGAAAGFLILKNRIDAHRESVFADAKTTAENIKTQQEATSQQIESYKQLKAQLDSGDLSEQETINVKQQILDIQKSITEQYGTAAQGVDLINGKLEEQVGLLNSISQKEAQDQYFKDYEGFQVAEQEYNKDNRRFTFGLNSTGNADLNKAITDILFKNGLIDNTTGTLGLENAFATVKGTASDSINALENTKQALEELKAEYRDRDTLEALNKQIAKIEEQIGEAYEVVDKYEATALRGLELNLASNDTNGYDIYKNYQSSVSNLENAYITGDTQKINEARKAFNEATKAKNDFLKVGDNGQFALLFDKIDTSLINTKNRFRDTVELFKDIPVPEEKEGLFGGTDKKTLKDNAKAQSKLTKEQKKAYKAAEKLYKLNPDKVDIQATLKDNTYASGKYADALKALMDAMGWTTADADNLINALVTAGIVHGDAADVAYMASDSYNAFSSSVESAIGVLNTLNTALTESAKGTGLTEQTLTELRAAFGDNLDSVLEKTANGYHLNTQGAYLLRQEQEAMVNADYASSMYEQYQALNKLQEGYLKAKEAGEDTSGFVQQRQAIQNNIDKLNESLMTFNNANSAYQTWLAKQNSEGEREMYNSVYSGYDAVKDELERGWAGEKTRSWLDLIFNDENEDWDAWTSSAEKVKEKFDEVTKDIKGTGGYSIADFFTVDANGKTTSQGVWNFFDAIQNKQKEVGKEFVNLEEGWFDFTENGDYQIAEMLGMDIESVHSILRAAADAGFEIHLDQPLFSLEQLKEKAVSAKDALEEATGTELKINIDPQNEEEVDDAMQKLMSYQQSLAEDTSLEPKVKTERLQQVADLLNFMAAKKREFVEKDLFDLRILDSKELEASKKNINDIVNKLSSYSKEAGKTEFSKQFAIDPMLLNNVDYLQEKIDTLKEIRPNVDDTQVQYLDQLLAQLQYRVNLLNETDISGGSITVDQLMAAEQVVDDINSKLDYASKHKDIEFNWDADETFIEDLNIIANLPSEVKQKWGIDPNATGEELLELAKKGELHLQVTTSGDVPKDTTSTNTQTNNTINKTTNITEEQVNQVVTASMDTSPFDKGAKHVQEENKKIDKQNPKPEVGMDSKEFKKGSDDVNKQTKELNNKKATPSVALVGKNQVINDAQAMKSAIDSVKSKTISITANFYHTGLSGMKSAIQSVLDKASELASNYTTHFANGTAHAHGTAFARGSVVSKHAYAGGKWGLPNDQTALTGELGTEIVVRDGNWFTVGENGAEFVNLKKGDIVFNHKQAQELLENGYVTSNKGRGHLVGFANGTAYSYGSSSGALRPSKTSTGMGGSTKSSGGSGGSGGSSGGNSSSNDAKETKNTLDEVEILIGRIEARISDLDKIIGSTYNTWEDRNDSILDNLKLVTQEISDQRNAYTTYMNKANSINLSESWKQKIRDGAFRIEDVTDSDLWDKIQEYQTWYNKAVASEQALIDLTNKRGELYKQLFDNTQTYYDNMVEAIQHEIDVQDTFIDRLEEAGRLSSKILIYRQYDQEQRKLVKLNEELQTLRQREKDAIDSGYIEYGSEAWSEMESAIADVCAAIEEAESNLVSYDKALNEVDWNRWDRIHDSIDGVVNELEFLYDLINEDDLFTEQGDLTNQGTTALSLLAHEYDVYFAEVQEYQKEIDQVQEDLAKDPYNQILVDKLKELKEAQQDAASGAKKMKESIVDVTEKGIKKQIDYVKKLIEDYEELLETQKDQIDYAKKVADQQKELNRLEKQYRAIQNDDSEETATRRQQLKNQIEEARQNLKETQDDRRLSETKDMLSKFEESFEEFLENKLKDIEGVVREAIDTVNTSRGVIKDTINDLASSYGYTPSDTLKSTLDDLSRSFVSYFNGQFENDNVASIADNVNKIVEYYQRVQNQTNQEAAQDTMTEAVRHDGNIQTYRDENGNLISGYFRSDGTRDETYTGWAEKQGRKYRFENGQQLTGAQFIDVDGKRYHLDSNGAVQTGWQKINDQWYYMNGRGEMQTGWQNLNGRWYYLNSQGQMQTGAQQINGKTYVMDESGAMLSGGWNKSNGKWYYLNSDGSAKTGWLKDNNKWYYLNSKGEMQTGAQRVDGKQYVFDGTGAMLSGGWRQYNGKWYYLDSSGVAKTGWIKDNNKWYYLNGQGEMLTGAQRIGNKTYVMDKSGAMLSNGWQYANGKWYYLNSDGSAKTGWQKVDGKWYLLDSQGAMKTGFYSESGKTYYMDGSGAMQTGWQKINGQWYYFNSNGAAASGWAELKYGSATNWYYFDPKTKAMLTNAWIDKSGVTTNPQKGAYYVTSDGTMVKNGRRSTNKGWLTFEKDGKWTGYKTGTSGVGTSGLYWTNEGNKAEAIIRKSDGAILTPLSKGDSVIPNSAMKNMYQALTDPAKYLKQYTTPDVRVIQNSNNSNGQPPVVNMQFIANGVQDANKFVNDLMNNKKLEKWVQEVTLGQANGNNNYKKYSYIVR